MLDETGLKLGLIFCSKGYDYVPEFKLFRGMVAVRQTQAE
jgi:hypothetical protein